MFEVFPVTWVLLGGKKHLSLQKPGKKKKKAEYLLPPPHCFLPDKPINQLNLPVALKSELTGKAAEGGLFIPVAIATFSFQEHQYWFLAIQFALVIFSPVLSQ